LADFFEIDLNEATEENIRKLLDRMKRNKIYEMEITDE